MFQVAEGKDPAADRKADRSKGTFEELAARYVEQYAKKHNKSWKQADALVRKYLIPRWGKLQGANISRADVKAVVAAIAAPVLANQVLASASAIFSWAIREELVKDNPARLVDRHKTTSRERVLSNSEIPKFWTAFDEVGLLQGTALRHRSIWGASSPTSTQRCDVVRLGFTGGQRQDTRGHRLQDAFVFVAIAMPVVHRGNAALPAAQTLGITIQPFGVREPEDIDRAFERMARDKPDALLVIAEALTISNRRRIYDFGITNRIPVLYDENGFLIHDGGLMFYGPDGPWARYPNLFATSRQRGDRMMSASGT